MAQNLSCPLVKNFLEQRFSNFSISQTPKSFISFGLPNTSNNEYNNRRPAY